MASGARHRPPQSRGFSAFNHQEPANHAVYGHARGDHAPGRTVAPSKEPYVAVHYMLLAHAHASAIYRQSFQPTQKGILSIALNADWREPLDSSAGALAASQRSLEFTLGWLADPLYFGDYPESMRRQLGARLPTFTPDQRRLLLNSTDFFALQHYSSLLVSERAEEDALPADNFYSDEMVNHHSVPGAKKNMLNWDIAPFGMYKLAKWIHRRYAPAGGIVVTENGLPLREESAEAARHDAPRTCYIKQYLQMLSRAMRDGVDVRAPRHRRRRRCRCHRHSRHPRRHHTTAIAKSRGGRPASSSAVRAAPASHPWRRPRAGARLLRVVAPRQRRVGGGRHAALRPRVRRLADAQARAQGVGRLLRKARAERLLLLLAGRGTPGGVLEPRASRAAPRLPLSRARGRALVSVQCNASVPTSVRFKQEAAELQAVVNRTGGGTLSAEQTLNVAARTARLALLAEMQARYDAEQGEFELMRYWLDKGQKLRAGAKRQQQLSKHKAAKQEEEERRQREEEEQQLGDDAGEADGLVSDELLMSLPGEVDGELAAEMAAGGGVASDMASAAEAVPGGLGLGLGNGDGGASEAGDATPPDELQELQAAPVEDEEVQRAESLGLQAAVVVTPLDSEEL